MGRGSPMRRPPKFVQAFIDRHGKARFYFRRAGSKSVALPGLPWSPEFMAAYELALGTAARQDEVGVSRTTPGTVNALVVNYYRSDEWKQLTPDTQKRHWLMTIRAVMRSAIPTMRKDDPTAGISIKLPKSKGHHTWSDDEIEQYRAHWPLGTQQRLVMEFALETTSRRGEVVRLGPQHVKNGRIHIERTHGSKDVDIPVSSELQAACDAMPRAHLTYVVTAYGKPRSKFGLGNDFAKWATEAGLPSRCRLHGLKKGGMRRLAEAGNTTHELMAISGHKTLTEVQRYTDDADRKLLAESGMAKRKGQSVNTEVSNPAVESVKPSAKALK